MRIGSVSLLVLAAFALAACAGAETGGGTLAASSINGLDIAPCTLETCPPNSDSDTDPITDADGDSVDDNADGNNGSTEGGNTTNLSPTTADVTIAVESSRVVNPAGITTSLSQLTAGTSPATTTAQILSGTKPTALTIGIDTNSASNGTWPTPVQMTEYPDGTAAGGPGNNGGAGAGYREYRVYSNEVNQERDESLQVWAWTDAYAAHYSNDSSPGDPTQQAWSFGGNRTPIASMPVGSATYNGRFVANAKTDNYVKPDAANIDPDALWRVQGASTVTANFGTAAITGTLTPATWESFQVGVNGYYIKTVGAAPTLPATYVEEPDYSFYNSTIALTGTITGNTYAGAANLSGPFISGDQTMYGGFFGATGAETAGVFHVTGMVPAPIGGSGGDTDPRRGFLTIQGAFHGCNPGPC